MSGTETLSQLQIRTGNTRAFSVKREGPHYEENAHVATATLLACKCRPTIKPFVRKPWGCTTKVQKRDIPQVFMTLALTIGPNVRGV